MLFRKCRCYLLVVIALALFSSQILCGDGIPFDADSTPDETLMAIVIDPEYSQQERMDVMRQVTAHATESDVHDRVAWFTLIVRDNSAPIVIRDYALEQLIRLQTLPNDLIAWVVTIPGDTDQNSAWRHSSVSRLPGLYACATQDERELIAQRLLGLLHSTDTEIWAPSLCAAGQIGEQAQTLHQFLVQRVEALIDVDSTDPEVVLSAITAASESGLRFIAPTLRLYAADTTLGFRLRLTAIGALGELGSSTDIDLLRQIRTQSLLRKACDTAIAKIENRGL